MGQGRVVARRQLGGVSRPFPVHSPTILQERFLSWTFLQQGRRARAGARVGDCWAAGRAGSDGQCASEDSRKFDFFSYHFQAFHDPSSWPCSFALRRIPLSAFHRIRLRFYFGLPLANSRVQPGPLTIHSDRTHERWPPSFSMQFFGIISCVRLDK